ncbi:uncharacterized protein LOC126782414 [Argentina anserina]|uniref:uncharacterized protein LOC126782414 n=1 Tax=Argentina anserina TaxID=57926 RepID=UPI0021769162|nr:uncharacterized protein LOC126782414 [Potentilla anserina]
MNKSEDPTWSMSHRPPRHSSIHERSESQAIHMNIDDLPGVVLVEILCRLPCYKLVFQLKCVSKRWYALISDPYFIGRFLYHLQTTAVEAPVTIRTLINRKGVELSWSPSCRSSNLLAPVFRKLMSFHGLKDEPVVKAIYNDLVLCCENGMDFYYICNPYTLEWVALPPSPRSYTWPHKKIPAAIICDGNYYDYTKEGTGHNTILLNADYRCKVVRILPFVDEANPYQSSKFIAEIFSSETGEWKESIIASPVPLHLNISEVSCAYNGMLYWWDWFTNRHVGMDPFMINSNGNGDHYKLRFMEFDGEIVKSHHETINCFGVCQGGLRMCYYGEEEEDDTDDTLYVWDWREEQVCDQNGAGSSELCWKLTGVYSLGLSLDSVGDYLAIDPNNGDMLYLDVDHEICLCNIRTGDVSRLVEMGNVSVDGHFLPLVLPWWPTPVPRLPKPSWLSMLIKKLRLLAYCLVVICSE